MSGDRVAVFPRKLFRHQCEPQFFALLCRAQNHKSAPAPGLFKSRSGNGSQTSTAFAHRKTGAFIFLVSFWCYVLAARYRCSKVSGMLHATSPGSELLTSFIYRVCGPITDLEMQSSEELVFVGKKQVANCGGRATEQPRLISRHITGRTKPKSVFDLSSEDFAALGIAGRIRWKRV